MSNSEQLTKMGANRREVLENKNDSAKFDELMWLSILTFITQIIYT